MKNSRLVFSTDQGRIAVKDDTPERPQGDGIIRLRRETKGRKGKGVTIAGIFDLDDAELKALAKDLKQRCGTGGTAKAGNIEIQGDQRNILKDELEQRGYKVKLAGG